MECIHNGVHQYSVKQEIGSEMNGYWMNANTEVRWPIWEKWIYLIWLYKENEWESNCKTNILRKNSWNEAGDWQRCSWM